MTEKKRVQNAEEYLPQDDDAIEVLFDKLDTMTETIIGMDEQIKAIGDRAEPEWLMRIHGAFTAYRRSMSALEKEIRYRERHQIPSLIVEQAKQVICTQFGKDAWIALIARAELLYLKEEGVETDD